MEEEKKENQSENGEQGSKKEKGSAKRDILEFAITFAVALLIAMFVKTKIIITANVPTGSMIATIQEEDKVFGYRLAYNKEDPKRGDIVIFYAPDEDDGTKYIKRLIGLPGEKVTIKDAKIYINDSEEPLVEDYLPEEWVDENDGFVFEVPEGAYFFMGDNRNSSWDARDWDNTYVYREDIIAKAEAVYFPFKDAKWLNK